MCLDPVGVVPTGVSSEWMKGGRGTPIAGPASIRSPIGDVPRSLAALIY